MPDKDHKRRKEKRGATMTLFDLAEELNVSISTISRALSRPSIVAPATRERILAAVEKLGFRPNRIARSLRTQETKTIGIIVPDITNSFFGEMVKAIGDIAKARDYTLIVCNADEDPANEVQALDVLRAGQVSGIINCTVGAPVHLWQPFTQVGIPLIELDRRSGLSPVDTVIFDDQKAAMIVAEHLIGLGHRRIATIAGPQHLSNARARLAGLKKALIDSAIPLPDEYIELGDFAEDSGYATMNRLLRLKNRPTAIFIANSKMTIGAMGALREQKVRVPRDLSLVGYYDERWARYTSPPLTMIDHPAEAMGRRAAELMFERLETRDMSRKRKLIVFPPHLIVRASTASSALAQTGRTKPSRRNENKSRS
jgi:DNA-binding LacI/PurR family transcriptional regulator